MCAETPKACLSYHIVPIDHDVNANCSTLITLEQHKYIQDRPFTSGGKLGLLKALRSYDESFETLLPLKRV